MINVLSYLDGIKCFCPYGHSYNGWRFNPQYTRYKPLDRHMDATQTSSPMRRCKIAIYVAEAVLYRGA